MDRPSETLEFDKSRFFEIIDDDEDLIAVLRGQIYVERRLNRLLSSLIPNRDVLTSRYSYNERVKAAADAGLISAEAKRALHWLGKLRNRFAHQDTVLTARDVEDARKSVTAEGALYIDEMIEYYKRDPRDIHSIIRFAIISVYSEMGFVLEESGLPI